MPVPANEVAERAELIRTALEADGGFPLVAPTEHGEAPITAVHDPGLVRFLEVAWSELRAQGIVRPFLSADTYPNRAMFEGMSEAAVAAMAREPVHAGGRAGFWGLDSAAPLVAGTYVAARAAVDVALTTVDLVLGGEAAAYGLCRPPGHHAARSMYGGYCFFNNAAIAAEAIVTATGERVAILDVDYHHGNGTQQIFWRRGDVRYVSIHADPDTRLPVFPGPCRRDRRGRRGRGEPQPATPARDDATTAYLAAVDRALEAIAAVPGSVVVVSLGFDTYGLDPIGVVRPDDRRLSRDRPADRRARPATGHPPGGRLPPAVARRERPGVAARRRGPPVRPAPGRRASVRAGRWPARVATGDDRRPVDAARLAHAVDQLAARDADLAAIVARFGPPPLWDRGRASGRCCTSCSSSRSRSPPPRRPTTGSGSPPIR